MPAAACLLAFLPACLPACFLIFMRSMAVAYPAEVTQELEHSFVNFRGGKLRDLKRQQHSRMG